jgi:hypothetical protein
MSVLDLIARNEGEREKARRYELMKSAKRASLVAGYCKCGEMTGAATLVDGKCFVCKQGRPLDVG